MSAKATYLGEDDGPEQASVFGATFPVGKAVEVDDDTAIRLMGNPFFRIGTKVADDVGQPDAVDEAAASKAEVAAKVAAADAARNKK